VAFFCGRISGNAEGHPHKEDDLLFLFLGRSSSAVTKKTQVYYRNGNFGSFIPTVATVRHIGPNSD
jgi:hypothetical protein